jgi:hypothetical protein
MHMVTIYDNLAQRHMDVNRTGLYVDPIHNTATFLLYNLSGQLVGYQRYNPNGTKEKNNSDTGRYFTYAIKEGEKNRRIAVWGVDTIQLDSSVLFVTEGIFDANRIHLAGYPAIAILSNASNALKGFFAAFNRPTIAIMDDDKAGQEAGKMTTHAFTVPAPYHDLDEMPQSEVEHFLGQIFQKTGLRV